MVCLEGKARPRGELWMKWDKIWNRPDVDKYSIFIINTQSEFYSADLMTSIPGFKKDEKVRFMIRSCVGKWRGEYGPILACTV